MTLSKINYKICNIELKNQSEFDMILNDYIEKIGSNICLTLSLAFARAYAKQEVLRTVGKIQYKI